MTIKRAHILLPEDLVKEIDTLVGPRGRSAFLVKTAREAVRRQKLLQFLNSSEPAWKNEDHSELKTGSAAWVRKVRVESERRSSHDGKRRG